MRAARSRGPLGLLLLMLLGGPAGAEPPLREGEAVTLARCLRLAADNAPLVQAQAARLRAAQGGLTQAGTLPNPVASYTAQDLGTPVLLHQAQLGFPLLAGLLRGPATRAARAGVQEAQAQVAEEQRLLRLRVGSAFHDLLLAERLADIEEDGARAAAAFVAGTRSRQRDGDAGPLDVVRAEAEALEAQRLAERAARQRDLGRLALSLVLGAPAPVLVHPASEPPDARPSTEQALPPAALALCDSQGPLPEELRALALAGRPDLLAARAALARALAQEALAARRAVPLHEVVVAVGARVSALQVGGVVQVALPLPFFDRQQGPRQQSAAQVEAARAGLLAAERQADLELRSALLDWRGARRALVAQARPLVAAREAARAAARRQLEAGVAGLVDVLLAERDLLAARRALAQAQRDVAVAAWLFALALGDG